MDTHNRFLLAAVLLFALLSPYARGDEAPTPGKSRITIETAAVPEEKDLPAWKRAMLKKLDATMSVDFTGQPLQEVLGYISKKADLNIILNRSAVGVDPATPIVLRLDDVTTRSVVSWTARLAGLEYILTDEAVFLSTLGDMGADWVEEIRTRQRRRQQEAQKTWVPKLQKKLDELTSFSFEATPLTEALSFLSSLHGINIVLDPRYATPRYEVTRSVEGMSVKNALSWLLRPHRLTYMFLDEAVFVTTPERARNLRTLVSGMGKDERFRRIVSVKISHATVEEALKALSLTTGLNIKVEGTLPEVTIDLAREYVPVDKVIQDIISQTGMSFAFSFEKGGLVIWVQKSPVHPPEEEAPPQREEPEKEGE